MTRALIVRANGQEHRVDITHCPWCGPDGMWRERGICGACSAKGDALREQLNKMKKEEPSMGSGQDWMTEEDCDRRGDPKPVGRLAADMQKLAGASQQPMKQPERFNVLQDWVLELPARVQGTLLTGGRGCDLAPKNPSCIDERYGCSTGENTVERHLAAFFRFCTLNPADPREIDVPGAWFQSKPPENWKPSQLGHYPLHWYSHIMHCYEVVGYCHPNLELRGLCLDIYRRLVHCLHLNVETKEEMFHRLLEDRVAAGTVVF